MTEGATINEDVTRLLAVVDWTDECEVQLHLRKRTTRLTADQARRIASALTRCADAADRARASAVRPVKASRFDLLDQVTGVAADIGAHVIVNDLLSPDCRADKHPTWHDDAWDNDCDVKVPCQCPCHTAGAAA